MKFYGLSQRDKITINVKRQVLKGYAEKQRQRLRNLFFTTVSQKLFTYSHLEESQNHCSNSEDVKGKIRRQCWLKAKGGVCVLVVSHFPKKLTLLTYEAISKEFERKEVALKNAWNAFDKNCSFPLNPACQKKSQDLNQQTNNLDKEKKSAEINPTKLN
jgi:hypothetical protein